MSRDRLKYIVFSIFLILVGLGMVAKGFGGGILDIIAGICGIIAGVMFILYRA